MTNDPRDPGSLGEDDLFDLPTESVAANESVKKGPAKTNAEVEIPAAALPRRPDRTGPAGPPLPNVHSTVDAILQEVRKRPAKAETAPTEPAPTNDAAPSVRIPRAVWIALGALMLINLAVLTFLVLRPEPAPTTVGGELTGSILGGAATVPMHATPTPELPPLPRMDPVLPNSSPLERAHQVLRDARQDIASGRRGTARARLGRLGLTVDAIEPASREAIRAEIGLLLAESTQADADEALGTKR